MSRTLHPVPMEGSSQIIERIRRESPDLADALGGPLLTTEETAQLLRIPAQTLRQWRCRRTGLPFIKIGGQIRYAVKSVVAAMNTPPKAA